jgi:glycosyltransferase involved in cell wall biosynthesis
MDDGRRESADPPVVAYVLTRYPVLSETFVRLEVRALRRAGTEVHVLALTSGDDPGTADEPYDLLWEPGAGRLALLRAHLVTALTRPRAYAAAWRASRLVPDERGEVSWRHLPWWARELRRRGVQVVHAHFGWSAATRARVLAGLAGLPFSVTVHGNDVWGRPTRLADKLAAADAVVAVCASMGRELQQDLPLRRPVTVVACGVEIPAEPPHRRPPFPVDVLAVGRLVPKKGFAVLLDALALLHERRLHERRLHDPRPPVRTVIVGAGPDHDALRERIEHLGLGDSVQLAGARGHDDTLDCMSRAAVVCVPSVLAPDGDRDSMPLVVKEALARGVPVVASDLEGIPEVLDERCGWLVPPGDPVALAGALEQALADPGEAAARGLAGRVRVSADFSVDGEVARLRALFADLARATG